MQLTTLNSRLNTLTIFRSFLDEPIVKKLHTLLKQCDVSAYCDFVSALYQETANFSNYVYQFMMNDENFYVKMRARGIDQPDVIEQCLKEELMILQEISRLTSSEVKTTLADWNGKDFLPTWETATYYFSDDYSIKLEALPFSGYGIFAKYHMFTFSDSEILPARYPDPQNLSQLSGYERERNQVLQNTEVLISGGIASNILLYGDAGTGKSSTIKAVANQYKDRGLRLIEVKKNQLYQLPDILEELAENPLKFIIFIDDLSFMSNDDNFSALKAILEGGVTTCGRNTVIYATSNRRHLVKETMTERSGDELYLNDTLQETMSLAARFGLTITFQRPDKDAYIDIVKHLAKEYGVILPEVELIEKAEAFAIRHSGRSPRTAKHFIELQKAGL